MILIVMRKKNEVIQRPSPNQRTICLTVMISKMSKPRPPCNDIALCRMAAYPKSML